MKKWILIISLVMNIVLAVYIALFKEDFAEYQVGVEQQIVLAVDKEQENKEKVIIDFKKIAPFEWDNMYVFTPYTSWEIIDNEMGLSWENSAVGRVAGRDQNDLIVFVKDNEVIGYVEHGR
ncbi:hypothetical protein [Ammoniphilus sp. 3BR4]|uniref:hypothetical protein n=1 Tax=Ammoniphilus sp. 3BR4 TaxID=3158265 RepID=UPI0034675429